VGSSCGEKAAARYVDRDEILSAVDSSDRPSPLRILVSSTDLSSSLRSAASHGRISTGVVQRAACVFIYITSLALFDAFPADQDCFRNSERHSRTLHLLSE
jgi:hypothetical protein